VILAMAFLLKLSFDRGWITPAVRLAGGFATGGVLLVLGLRLERTRRRLAQILLGGSIAIFYLVGFAGFQLYELLPFPVALALMSSTTVLAIVLSEPQDSPLLAVIGVSGGLATPFLLETGSGNVAGLSFYAALVLLGAGAVQLHRGWASVLGTAALGGAIVLALAASGAAGRVVVAPSVALAVYALVCVASPLARPLLRPDAPPRRRPGWDLWMIRLATTFGTAVTISLLAVVLSLSARETGGLLLLVGLAAAAASHRARGVRLTEWPAAELAALSLAFGLWLVVGDPRAMLPVAAEAAVLLALAARGAPGSLRPLAHALSAAVMIAFLVQAGDAPLDGFLGLRAGATIRLGVLAMLIVDATLAGDDAAPLYRAAAYVGLLVWFLSELGPRANGAALVSIAWALQGAVALVVSIRSRSQTLQLAGLATLGLVAGKLLLVDLARLDAVWRILLFFGFGVALLGLAWLVNRPALAAPPGGGGSGGAAD
jgi:uncharacterized membrane protein